MVVRNGPGEQQRARVVPVLVGLDHFRARGRHELAGVDLQAMPGLRLDTDVSLFEVFKSIRRSIGGVDDVERLPETDIQMKSDGRGRAINGNHAHAEMHRVGADIEVA